MVVVISVVAREKQGLWDCLEIFNQSGSFCKIRSTKLNDWLRDIFDRFCQGNFTAHISTAPFFFNHFYLQHNTTQVKWISKRYLCMKTQIQCVPMFKYR